MATMEEILAAKGVASFEELEAKIAKEAADKVAAEKETAAALLKKQIADLEGIKAKQGDELGLLRKTVELAKENQNLSGTKKLEDAGGQGVKTEAQWKADNDAIEQSLDENAWNALDEALKTAAPEVRRLATSSEEGRAAFLKAVVGPVQTKQETFRRPVQEKKLSIEEQIQIGLGKIKPNVPPALRPSGSGFDPNKPINKINKAPNPALLRTGSLRDMVAAHKET